MYNPNCSGEVNNVVPTAMPRTGILVEYAVANQQRQHPNIIKRENAGKIDHICDIRHRFLVQLGGLHGAFRPVQISCTLFGLRDCRSPLDRGSNMASSLILRQPSILLGISNMTLRPDRKP